MGKSKKKRPQDWSAEEKYQAVMETGALNEEERSAYCRRNGIFAHHLDLWREQCLAAMRKGPKVDVEKKQLESKLKTVTKELNRKEKALAEAAALLVLQKKNSEYIQRARRRGALTDTQTRRRLLACVDTAMKAGASLSAIADQLT